MNPRSPFRLLFRLFEGRFFESDEVSPGGGFQTNIHQVLGLLATSGFVVAYLSLPMVGSYLDRQHGANLAWALRQVQLFHPAFTFAVIGFTAFFEWDMLFPTRRDFLVLAPFPIRLRDLFAAQFTALARFLGLLIAAVNVFPILFTVLMSFSARFRGNGLRLVLAEIAGTVGVSAFAFIGVAALQGVLINVTSPRLFRRISPYIQMCGMGLMILSLLTFPIYAQLLRPAAEHRQVWVWFFPPVWFMGFYDLFFPNPHGLFAVLGIHAIRTLAAAVALLAMAWTAGFRRQYRRTLEAEDSRPRAHSVQTPALLARSPEERAIFRFSGKTLARSRKHQLFLATYLSVGISLALIFGTAVRAGKLAISHDGARAVPFLVAFFVISGFRAVFQFPAELPANWLFRITESRWAEMARAVTRKRVLISGLAPVLLLLVPAEVAVWGTRRVPFELLFQFAAGALLIEAIFWTFDKVPFTCSYFPGRTNLSILFAAYLYGFSYYSFNLADLEADLEKRFWYGALVLVSAAVLLTLSWRYRREAGPTRFDAYEPAIQTLNLN